jgi:hypothetical protein
VIQLKRAGSAWRVPDPAKRGWARATSPESDLTGTLRMALDILPQPDDSTCGPTCLAAVYAFFGDHVPIQQLIDEVTWLPNRGTLAVLLGQHALERGYGATLFTYNLDVFDPSWFREGVDIATKLRERAALREDAALKWRINAYLEFLSMGGQLRYEELNPPLVYSILQAERPILTGLSATYLYGCAREIDDEEGRLHYDDVKGDATGHFVVLYGFHEGSREVLVADPLRENPLVGDQHYSVGIDRLLGAIMLGVTTYDGNLLVLDPPADRATSNEGEAAP